MQHVVWKWRFSLNQYLPLRVLFSFEWLINLCSNHILFLCWYSRRLWLHTIISLSTSARTTLVTSLQPSNLQLFMSSYVLIHCNSGQRWLQTFNLARTTRQGEDRRRQWPRLSKSGGRLLTVNCQQLDLLRYLRWWQQIFQDLHLLDGMVERYCHHGKRPLFLENKNLDILFLSNTFFVFNDKKGLLQGENHDHHCDVLHRWKCHNISCDIRSNNCLFWWVALFAQIKFKY